MGAPVEGPRHHLLWLLYYYYRDTGLPLADGPCKLFSVASTVYKYLIAL
jgi:hypothetical protein